MKMDVWLIDFKFTDGRTNTMTLNRLQGLTEETRCGDIWSLRFILLAETEDG